MSESKKIETLCMYCGNVIDLSETCAISVHGLAHVSCYYQAKSKEQTTKSPEKPGVEPNQGE